MFQLYTTTVDRKWGQQYLSSEFFQLIHQVWYDDNSVEYYMCINDYSLPRSLNEKWCLS